jgi:hypothetical protein
MPAEVYCFDEQLARVSLAAHQPDLLLSIFSMLEDFMRASLLQIIRMVSVNDLGQGSELIRTIKQFPQDTEGPCESTLESGTRYIDC